MKHSDDFGQYQVMAEKNRISILVLAVTGACTLDPATLDGDEAIDDEAIGDGDDGGVALAECLAGSNLDGSTQAPVEFQFVDDVVDCGSGWGHDVPLLAGEWSVIASTAMPAALLAHGDGVEVILHDPNAPPEASVWFTAIDEAGVVGEARFAPAGLTAFIHYATVDDEGRLIVVHSHPDEPDHYVLGMLDAAWETLVWSVMVDTAHLAEIAPFAGGFLLVGSDDPVHSTRVFRISNQGNLLDDMPTQVPFGEHLVVSGEGFALGGDSTIARFDADGSLDWEWIDDEIRLLDIAGDDLGVIAVGERGRVPWVARIDQGEIEWSTIYRRADSWYADGAPEEPREIYDFAFRVIALPDGSFVAGGAEALPGLNINQPWLVRFTGAGQTLARDRMFVADGIVIDATASNGAVYGMSRTDLGHVIRKYPL